jgi:peptidoglycan/LPS O-acetylase OafA/YrhL
VSSNALHVSDSAYRRIVGAPLRLDCEGSGVSLKQSETRRLPKLDFLRAASAAIVIASHYGFHRIPAGFGVLVFFVISGFLITYLLLRENQRTGTISLKDFYARRALRIFPAFYVYWIVAVAALLVRHIKILWPAAIASLFYVENYYQGLHWAPTLFTHTWSLSVEEQFYILWPGVFLLCRGSMKGLIRGLVVVIPCLWIYRAALQHAGVSDQYIYTSFETRIDSILAGCLLAIILFTGAAAGWVQEIRKVRYIPFVLACLAASVLWGEQSLTPMYKNTFGFAIDPVLVALLILQLTTMKGWGWMDAAPISYLGRISYSTYLYQAIVLPLLRPRLPAKLSLIGCFVGIWIVAAISYELVEKPFLRLKRRYEVVKVPEEMPASG